MTLIARGRRSQPHRAPQGAAPSARRRWGLLGAATTCVLALSVGRSAESTGPGVRNAHGLAFDGHVSLLFGGANEREVLADTWGWDGTRWRAFDAPGPAARTFPVMVSAGDAGVLLFGGRRVLFGDGLAPSQLLDDLWSWRDQRWVPIAAPGPGARAEAAGAWDPVRQQLVVFGGYTSLDGRLQALGDTWEYGQGQWREVTVPGPTARYGAVAAFDRQLGEVVLTGGNGAARDTWAWNGTRWRRLSTGDGPGVYNAVASTGAESAPLVRFGGWDGARRRRETWTLRDGLWRQLTTRGPAARNHSALTYDSLRRRYVLVGGHDGARVFGDVWEMAGQRWRYVGGVPARARVENGH